MKLNQRGGTLVTVLLVILVFSVLGFALLSSVIGENKRTNTTESNMQARYLAESGQTYFVSDVKKFIDTKLESINPSPDANTSINDFLDYFQEMFLNTNKYSDGLIVGNPWSESNPEQIRVNAEFINGDPTYEKILDNDPLYTIPNQVKIDYNEKKIKVTSVGKDDSNEKELTGYYKLIFFVDFEGPKFELADFTNNGVAFDFAETSLVDLNIILLDLGLINPKGPDKKFYRVPNDSIIDVNVLGPVLGFNIGDGERFEAMEKGRVIATREGEVLGLDLFKYKRYVALPISILQFVDKDDTNVVIDGGFTDFVLLGITHNAYRDIDFKKLAIIGNAIIQQDRYGWSGVRDDDDVRRKFSFVEGLFVNNSLVIGGSEGGVGKLRLRGKVFVMKDLKFKDIDLRIGDSPENEANFTPKDYLSDFYVKGNASITNTCLSLKSDDYEFRLFAEGRITIENNSSCNEYKGLFYAKNGIEIKPNGKKIIIRGGLIGDVIINEKDKEFLEYIPDPNYLDKVEISDVELINKGRTLK